MFILRKILKFILLPVSLLLFLIKWAVELAVRMTSALVNILIFVASAGVIYYLCTQRWTELFLMVVIGVGIIAVLFVSVIVQETCDSLRNRIRRLWIKSYPWFYRLLVGKVIDFLFYTTLILHFCWLNTTFCVYLVY